ncbi:FAD-binding protein [Devosia oryzisoli]|uniref:FAD-binding protein n=1 Tax=Devosia oryzisoli TaxID=2774138 RepID=UPI001AEE42AE|nr:FAD-binding protein [Devosia oryzisoli]
MVSCARRHRLQVFGRDNALDIAIRGGGHNGPGLGSVDDGLMIDLSMMKGVHVDPASATVRVNPGCTSGDVDHATHAFGIAVPFGIVSTTGVGLRPCSVRCGVCEIRSRINAR